MQPSPFFVPKRLPRRPYCTDDPRFGIHPRRLDFALERLHLQLNPPGVCMWMMFDIDRSDALCRWSDVSLPPPSWTACDHRTGRGHAVYGLEFPIRTSVINKQTRLLAAVEDAITLRLDADRGYAGLITKNPMARNERGLTAWKTVPWETRKLYTLTEMLDWIDLPKQSGKATTRARVGFGRNVEVFDLTRHWAYRAYCQFHDEGTWLAAVLNQAVAFSLTAGHACPLANREVMGIAKSVGRWVWKRRVLLAETFRARQSALGRLGGRPSLGEPWKELGIGKSSYFSKIATGKITAATIDAFRAHAARISNGNLD